MNFYCDLLPAPLTIIITEAIQSGETGDGFVSQVCSSTQGISVLNINAGYRMEKLKIYKYGLHNLHKYVYMCA